MVSFNCNISIYVLRCLALGLPTVLVKQNREIFANWKCNWNCSLVVYLLHYLRLLSSIEKIFIYNFTCILTEEKIYLHTKQLHITSIIFQNPSSIWRFMSPQWVQNLYEVIFLFLHTRHIQFHLLKHLHLNWTQKAFLKYVVDLLVLISKELNHLVAILQHYAGGLIFMK